MKTKAEYEALITAKKQEKLRLEADAKIVAEALRCWESEAADAALWALCDPGTRAAAAALPPDVLHFLREQEAGRLVRERRPFGWPSERSLLSWELVRPSAVQQEDEVTLLGRAALVLARRGHARCGVPDKQA